MHEHQRQQRPRLPFFDMQQKEIDANTITSRPSQKQEAYKLELPISSKMNKHTIFQLT